MCLRANGSSEETLFPLAIAFCFGIIKIITVANNQTPIEITIGINVANKISPKIIPINNKIMKPVQMEIDEIRKNERENIIKIIEDTKTRNIFPNGETNCMVVRDRIVKEILKKLEEMK